MQKRQDALPIGHAVEQSATLAALYARMLQSQARLRAVLPLLPPTLAQQLQPASLEDGVWCLLAPNAACASKLRQLSPQLLAHLNGKQLLTREIRIKITT